MADDKKPAKKTAAKKTTAKKPAAKKASDGKVETLHGVDYEVTPDRGFRRKS